MLRVGARDRPAAGLAVLSLLESATLDVIMKAFVKGLFDDEVRKDTIRGLTTTGRSLRGLCTLAEDADRAKKELHKLLDEEHKTRELDFYRDVVRQNMAQEKIESLLATYRAQPVPKEWAFDNPFEKPSLTPQVAKPAPLGETSGNSTHRPKPNNQSYHPDHTQEMETDVPNSIDPNPRIFRVDPPHSINTSMGPGHGGLEMDLCASSVGKLGICLGNVPALCSQHGSNHTSRA